MRRKTRNPHPNNHDDDQLLTIAEAAAYLRTPIATLRYWRHCGTGPDSLKIGRHVMYWRSDLDAWIEDQRRRGNAGRSAPSLSTSAQPRTGGST